MTVLASHGRRHRTVRSVTGRWPRPRRVEVAYGIGAVLAAALAVASLRGVTVPVDSDLGLVAVLPPAFWIAVVLLNVLFVVAIVGPLHGRPVRVWPLQVLTVALVATLYGSAAWISPYPRGEVSWRHIGIADALTTSGVAPDVDAYFNWPGYFALLAQLTSTTGVDPLSLALVAPVLTVLLWLCAMALVFRAFTTERRHLWLSLWVFALGNWQDQDYLSPQAFAFFLHLVVLALVLTSLSARAPGPAPRRLSDVAAWWARRRPVEPDPRRRVAALAICLLLIPVVVASHQLTPFMLLLALGVLTLTGRVWVPGLVVIAVVVLGLWLAFPASSYLVGHPPLAGLDLDSTASANVSQRLTGTPGHVVVVRIRLVLAGALWMLAAAGVVRHLRRREAPRRPEVVTPALLMAAPFALVPTQSYGGEMLIRASLFALPFTSFLAASALLPGGEARPRHGTSHDHASPIWSTSVLAVVLSLTAALMVTGRYGNTRFDLFTRDEVRTAQLLPSLVAGTGVILSAAHPTPWRNTAYLQHRYRTITGVCPRLDLPRACADQILHLAAAHDGDLLIHFSRSTSASLVLQGQATPSQLAALERLVAGTEGTTLVLERPDARVYKVVLP